MEELQRTVEQPWKKRQNRPNLHMEEQLELYVKLEELQRTVEQPWKKRQNRPNLHLEEQLELRVKMEPQSRHKLYQEKQLEHQLLLPQLRMGEGELLVPLTLEEGELLVGEQDQLVPLLPEEGEHRPLQRMLCNQPACTCSTRTRSRPTCPGPRRGR